MASLSVGGFAGFLGSSVVNGWKYINDIIVIIYVSLKAFVTLSKGKKRVINEILYKKLDRSVVNTSAVIGVVAFIFGAMVVTQISLMGLRMDVLGTIFDMVIIKEFRPSAYHVNRHRTICYIYNNRNSNHEVDTRVNCVYGYGY